MSRSTACDKVEYLFCECDNNASREGQKTVSSLRGVVGFERKTNLYNTEAEQDKTDSSDKSEDKGGQVVDYAERITARRKRCEGSHKYCG